MTKRETRKEAYRQIVKQNRSHQEVFDELRGSSSLDVAALATLVGAIPSAEKRQQNKTLAIVFIVVCAIVILLRVLGVASLPLISNMNLPLLILALALGLVVPVVAIIGMITWRVEMLTATAGLLLLSLIRTFTNDKQFLNDSISLVFLIPHVTAIILAFFMPYRLKTGYRETVIKEEKDGSQVSRKTVIFEKQEKVQSLDLLDS